MINKKKIYKIIWVVGTLILFLSISIPSTVCSKNLTNYGQENRFGSEMKTLFMKGNSKLIILYKVWWYPVHLGPFWFTSEHAYLAFMMYEHFTLKINGIDQDVELPAMVVPWNFIGLGPLFWIRNIVDPCNGNFTLRGICEDVIIKPINNSMTT